MSEDTKPIDRQNWNQQTSAETYNAKLGMVLFVLYTLAYAAFVVIIAIDWKIMATDVIWGVNLAVVYGLSLIAGAFLMALIYLKAAR